MHRLRFSDLHVPAHLPHTHVTRLTDRRESVPHSHDFYETFLVLEGAGVHRLNGREHALAAGHLVAIRPPDVHSFRTTEDGVLVFVNVAVSAVWWEAFHTLFGWPCWSENGRSAVLSAADTQRLGRAMGRDYAAAEATDFIETWRDVRAAQQSAADAAPAAAPAWLEAVRQEMAMMPDALDEPISFWQRRSGCSPEHLSRTCRRYYGMTFRELISQARIERAKFLLRSTDKKVISVAFDCGFGNMANFHRTFARLTGMTPNQWRTLGTKTVPVGPPAPA